MKNKEVLISHITWNKSELGDWVFEHHCDGQKRIWNKFDNGFIRISCFNRIEGYCIKGFEYEWKIKMLESAISDHADHIKEVTEVMNELQILKLTTLILESNHD